jgi:hypothetical protein
LRLGGSRMSGWAGWTLELLLLRGVFFASSFGLWPVPCGLFFVVYRYIYLSL